jgi:hypothetical protein
MYNYTLDKHIVQTKKRGKEKRCRGNTIRNQNLLQAERLDDLDRSPTTRQDKTMQANTTQDKTRQDKTRLD